MSLLAPAGLIALLPLIVFLHLRHARYRGYTLSSTLLWSRLLAETPRMRPRRLPVHLLLLALQLAAVACGALALARPALDAGGPRSTVVVAVDTSFAMGATDVHPTRLARARAVVDDLIAGLAPWDTMTIVDLGASPRVLATSSDHATLHRAVADLADGVGPSSLAADAPLLEGLWAASGPHAQMRLLAPPEAPRAALDLLRRAIPALRIQPIGAAGGDRAVAGLTVSCPEDGAWAPCEAYARLINTGTAPVTTRVTALVDGSPAARTIRLPARSSTPLRLALPGGAHLLEVRLDGHDALAGDDAAWALAPSPVPRTVLLVTRAPASPVAQALRAMPNLRLQVISPGAADIAARARRADLTVVAGAAADGIPGNLLVIHPPGGSALLGRIATVRSPGVTSIDTTSPLLRGVDLSSLVLYTASRARLPAWGHVDIGSSAGPLLFDGMDAGRRVAVLLIDPGTRIEQGGGHAGSNLSTLLAFPMLLQNAVAALSPAAPADPPAGQVAAEPVSGGVTTWLRWSSGRAVALPSAGDIAVIPPLAPGAYTLSGGITGALVVNAAVPGDPLAPPQPTPAQSLAAGSATAPAGAAPWEFWTPAVLLALLALIFEWWYYVRRT